MKREKIQAEDNAGHRATRVAWKKKDLKQQVKEKTHKQKIMLDTVLPEQQNKKYDPKQHGKEKTYKKKLMQVTV